MYYNMDTHSFVAKNDEELAAYYERTYKENVEGGYIDPEECSLEDWSNDDAAIEWVPIGEILFDEASGTHYRIDDYISSGDYAVTSVIVDDYGNVEEELSSTILTAREFKRLQ